MAGPLQDQVSKPAPREDVAALARMAGLDLSPEQFEELLAAYRHVEPVLARLPRERSPADEPAHVFDPRRFMPKTGGE